jgi:transglutaminase-like putative cysteine protease
MRRAIIYCFLLFFPFGATSALAESDKHFEGPYRITTAAPKKVRATVKSAYRYPNMVAREWLVAYALPPEFAGQTRARGRIQIAETSLAEPGRITDESALRQPLATLHWIPETTLAAQSFTVLATYDVTITRRSLEPGDPTAPVPALSRSERSAFVAPSNHFDFTSSKFQAWLREEDLKRKPGERDLDFAYRAMAAMVRNYTYRFEIRSDRSATAVCKAGWSDCGGLATVYVSILRANGIPARCLSGRILKPDSTHVRMDFHAEGVGWVPGDPAVAIGAHSADAGFGRERTDMVIMHFDLIRFQRHYYWLQGIGAVRSINEEAASAAGMTLEHVMTVEELPDGDEPAAGVTGPDEPKKRGTRKSRRRVD